MPWALLKRSSEQRRTTEGTLFFSQECEKGSLPQYLGLGIVAMLIGASLLALTGCSAFVDRDQLTIEPGANVRLEPGYSVGQTFVARHAGLSGVEIWLEPKQGSQGEIRLHLRAEPQATEDLATAVLPLAQMTDPGFYTFPLQYKGKHSGASPPLRNSHGQYYYAFLELAGTGTVQIGAGPGETYLDGAMYRDHLPLDAQMAFRLAYEPAWMLLDLGQTAVGGVGLLLLAGLLFVVPGWALLTWLLPGGRLSWAERLGVAVGLSLALYPLLLLWTNLVGLRLGSLYAWLPITGGLVAIAWRYRAWRPRRGWTALRQWARSEAFWPDFALIVVLGLIFAVRLLVVRTLDAPMWGDSYQHTMIAQLLVDRGGLFNSWEPYVPYQTLTVHFGFPAAVALFSWASGIGSIQATLWVGQLINALAALTLYPLAVRIADGQRWTGVGAVLAAGLLSPMPAEYVNWGRYAQLAGQTILPVALWFLWEATPRNRLCWKRTLLAGVTLSGMALTYYRMPFFYAPFVLAWLIGWGLPHWKTNLRYWLVRFISLALISGAAILLFLPWGLHVAGGQLATALEAGTASSASLEQVLGTYRVWRQTTHYVPLPLLTAALVALVLSLAQRRWAVASIGLWVLGLASLVAGRLIRLPGANMMQNFAILIALYIPVGLLIGWLLGQLAVLAKQWVGKAGQWILATAVVTVATWAAVGQIGIVKPSYILVTRPDVRAMDWIRENTTPQACFLVEGFLIYEGYSAVGADAGWWIPLLAERQNTMPPQYALMNEAPTEPEYTQRVVDLVAHLETTSPASPEGVRLLCDWGITYVYVGQGQGKVGAGAVQLFPPTALVDSPAFSTVYHQDRVHIFELNPQSCQAGEKGEGS